MRSPAFAEAHALVFDAYGTLFDVSSIDQALQAEFGPQASQIAPVWR